MSFLRKLLTRDEPEHPVPPAVDLGDRRGRPACGGAETDGVGRVS